MYSSFKTSVSCSNMGLVSKKRALVDSAALPLGVNGAQMNLTPEQMAEAAGRLAGVVQSGQWGALAQNGGTQGQWGIPLGGHPDFPVQSVHEEDDVYFSEREDDSVPLGEEDISSKKNKKKKKKNKVYQPVFMSSASYRHAQEYESQGHASEVSPVPTPPTAVAVPPKPNAPSQPRQTAPGPRANGPSTTSDAKAGPSTEREKIRDFWLGLSEDDRRALVKVEKEAVLRKMKEQQRHGCTCAVCGRKRTAIEQELEVLYDAYYVELEQYANHQRRSFSSGGVIPLPPGPGPFPGSVDVSTLPQPAAAEKPKVSVPPKRKDHKNPKPVQRKLAPPATEPCNHEHGRAAHGDLGRGKQAQPQEEYDDGDEDDYDEEDEDEDEEYEGLLQRVAEIDGRIKD
jgi:hypothetical protein